MQKLLVKNLTKNFTNKQQIIHVLDNISLYVNSHEFVSIIGPSGCGKSTLFNIISGIDKLTSGSIRIDGNMNQNRLGKSGYMLQNPLLLPWRTVLDNMLLGQDIQGIPRKESRLKAKELLKTFGLLEFSDGYPQILSGGMKQRIALLRTILFHQDFLLLDEPFGALDALTRLSCQLWLLDVLKTYKSSVLFITHDINEAVLLSDRIYVFSNRPASILGEFVVHLPRPRKKEDVTDKKVVSLEKQLLQLLIQE